MSTGTSLFWIAFLAAIGFSVYKIHQKKKWGLVLKIFAGLVLISLIISACAYAYVWSTNRPHEATSLGKVSLGMSPVDVTLLLGKPDGEWTDPGGEKRFIYGSYGDTDYLIRFGADNTVGVICTYEYYNDVFGLGVYDSESAVLKKLGPPTNTSINKDGLMKFISYEKFKVAFGIAEGSVDSVCVTKSGKVSFIEEYTEQR